MKEVRVKSNDVSLSKNETLYISNVAINNFILDEMITKKISGPVLDVAFLRYSAQFSNRYQYPDTYVDAKLDATGLALAEFRIEKIENINNCKLSLLLKKGLPVLLPQKSFYNKFQYMGNYLEVPISLPRRPLNGETEAQSKHRLNTHDFLGASRDVDKIVNNYSIYLEKKNGGKHMVTIMVLQYEENYYPEYDFISFRMPCFKKFIKIYDVKKTSVIFRIPGAPKYNFKLNLLEKFRQIELPTTIFTDAYELLNKIN